jgi:translation initiation factor 5A
MSTSKTGKHGSAKIKFVGKDIFTGKKYCQISPSSHDLKEVQVVLKKWQVLEIHGPIED